MKVLVASHGDRADDFSFAVPGEVVMLGAVCHRDEYGDGECGCGRAFTGLSSHRGTTVAVVAEVDTDLDSLAGAILDSMTQAGWRFDLTDAVDVAEEIAAEAAHWPLGTQLRRVQPDDELVPA